jgi:hypothetical protein
MSGARRTSRTGRGGRRRRGEQAPLEPVALADYEVFHDVVRRNDPTAAITSPDFLDTGSLESFMS